MSIASVLRDEVTAAPIGTWFTTRELSSRLGERRAIDLALSRTAKSGDLVRVRRGIYWKGEKTRFGTTTPDTFSAGLGALRSFGITAGVGPTGWSASSAIGLSTQIPAMTHIAVPGRPPAAIRGVKYHARSSRWRSELLPLEVATLEVLRDFPFRIEAEWDDLVERLLELHEMGSIDLYKIASVAEKETHVAARERARKVAALAAEDESVSA